MDVVIQVAILVLSGSSIWFIGRKEEWRKWGYLLGLISQPFWLYSTYTGEQWGIFALGIWYTYAWLQGIWNYIIEPKLNIDLELY